MILQPRHGHDSEQQPTEPKSTTPPIEVKTQPQKTTQKIISPPKQVSKTKQQLSPSILRTMLIGSKDLLNQKGRNQISVYLKSAQEKVFLSFSETPNQYLEYLNKNQSNQTKSYISRLLEKKQGGVLERILEKNLEVKQKSNNIKQLKEDLKSKITDMKSSIVSLEKSRNHVDSFMEFRQKAYWLNKSETGENVEKFMEKMKILKNQQQRNHRNAIKKQQLFIKEITQKEKQEKQEEKKKAYAKVLEKQQQLRIERKKYYEQEKNKVEQTSQFLGKFRNGKPIYIKNQQNFKKSVLQPLEESRREKLEQIRQQHHPLDHDEIEEHAQRYNQYKESLKEEHSKKEEQENELNSKLASQLKELFHGKHHRQIVPRWSTPSIEEKYKLKQRQKIEKYSKSVYEKHKPQVSERKRQKIKKRIMQLELSENKDMRKVTKEDGKVVFEKKQEIDRKKIGISYLQDYLRSSNEGKPRKNPEQRSSSMMELSQKKKQIDYLRESRPSNLKLRYTMSSWKKYLQKQDYSDRDRYLNVMDHVSSLQLQAKQKQMQVNNTKQTNKRIELKEQLDKFYLESVAAKMVVLKDVILKQ